MVVVTSPKMAAPTVEAVSLVKTAEVELLTATRSVREVSMRMLPAKSAVMSQSIASEAPKKSHVFTPSVYRNRMLTYPAKGENYAHGPYLGGKDKDQTHEIVSGHFIRLEREHCLHVAKWLSIKPPTPFPREFSFNAAAVGNPDT